MISIYINTQKICVERKKKKKSRNDNTCCHNPLIYIWGHLTLQKKYQFIFLTCLT